MDSELREYLEALEARLGLKIEEVETRLEQKIEKVETSLLTEFHKWASPTEARLQSHSAVLRALDGNGSAQWPSR